MVQEFSHAGGVETVAFELQRCWATTGTDSQILAATTGPGVDPETARRVHRALPPWFAERIATRGLGRYLGRAAVVPAFTLAATAAIKRARRPGGWAEGALVLSHGDCLIADVVVIHAVNAASLAQKRREGRWRWALNPMHAWVATRDRHMLRGLRARRYVAVSRRVVDELARFHGIPSERVVVIPNGVDLDRFHPAGAGAGLRNRFAIPGDAPLLLFVGHEFDRKGLAQAIGALAQHGCGTAHLVAVGAGDVASYVRIADASGVGARVHFTGPHHDLPALYRDADAFLFPTSYETFSLVCMEAMATGLPVFAPRVGGIEDYLEDGLNGRFIERDGKSIGATLSPFLADPARLRVLGAAARNTAENYAWPKIATRYRELMQEVWYERRRSDQTEAASFRLH